MPPFPSFTKTWHNASYPAISPSRPELSLAGKTVLITGGGSGIGLSTSKSIAQAGAKNLIIFGRRLEVLTKAANEIQSLVGDKTNIILLTADVSNASQVAAAFATIATKLPGTPLDVLVSNAGFGDGIIALGSETPEAWKTFNDININGVYFITTAFVKHAAENATIINISTAIAHLPATKFPGFGAYAATKLAGSKIVEYVQAQNPGLRVVDLHPGQVTTTEMASKVNSEWESIDDPGLAGDFAVWAMSPEAAFLKGKFVWVNWDVEELKAEKDKILEGPLLTLGLVGFARFE